MTDFKELREALAVGPTDGPWKAARWTSDEGGCYGWSFSAGGYLLPLSDMETDNPDECDANARYIAAANPAVIRSLLDRLEAAERDAERYRWLRTFPNNINRAMYGPCLIPNDSGLLRRDDYLDAAIDAAMKEQQP